MGEEYGTVRKPSRSDEVLDSEQQLRITDQIRAHFDSLTPKRPAKPNRSESQGDYSGSTTLLDHDRQYHNIPEHLKFEFLSSQSQPICPEEGVLFSAGQEEFVETQYYNNLNSIEKQHHTTGTGFIRVSEGSGDRYIHELQLQQRRQYGAVKEMGFGSNPATNDWY